MSEPTKEWWDRILSYNRVANKMDIKENNMAEQENNMPGGYSISRLELDYSIKLPLGTTYTTRSKDINDSEVIVGLLGELERLIFILRNRVTNIEDAQNALVLSVNASLERIESIFAKVKNNNKVD